MHISKDQLEALLLIGLRFAELTSLDYELNSNYNELEDLQQQMRVVYQQLLDGDANEFTIDELTQYIIDLNICII